MEILRLKDILKSKGITGKDLAEKVDVTPASISNIVQGNSFPKPELLLKISDVLDVDVRELFFPTKDFTPLNGFIEINNEVHRVKSLDDLKRIINIISPTK
ncbi:DNA-binding XRE family transcriptional regulator [Ulvibacter sp. MAR_2010_11]|uniref:helix-turn-helix domain-containing protein n=1 Tax=Ulvibacter sp. MAR_2010_11 TaxID=1250229 RepID=UPI000C2C7330|nr:helix-turn-helix transcriptional regulator [Ulvibacter sp. MAR_2010_11]PKA83597.1 DNA-binding XRE family transcriptional regulator [Ulvibacter sp. MAR_2010_11]